jgi:hypothetical protein
MDIKEQRNVEEAFNSMLRSDYIPLKDTNKLSKLAEYYVDYLGFLREIVGETDHLIVGRRGTGKTTLLYRGLIECINSWASEDVLAKPKTLGIYLDLSKCQSLEDTASRDFLEFEHVFASEIYESTKNELQRTWPELDEKSGIIQRIFSPTQTQAKNDTNSALNALSRILKSGVLRSEDRSGKIKENNSKESNSSYEQQTGFKANSAVEASASSKRSLAAKDSQSFESSKSVSYRLTISDILRALNDIRESASISHIVIFIDEFSSLNNNLQRRFSTLIRKILGNHSGVFLKLCAITDNYTLGSSIILQRDLFELNLDLDSYVERSGNLGAAMKSLDTLTRKLIIERIRSYSPEVNCAELFEDFESTVKEVTFAAMGVPRTVGIILKQALSRSLSESRQNIRKSDIEYGIKYASKAYINQFFGSCGVAIPAFYRDMWDALLERAIQEREKVDSTSSHFMVLPKNENKLKYFNMFFISHLLTQGRTTKKEKASRSLYCFDYGICIENNMQWGTDKDVIRQQRFAYDSILDPFDKYFSNLDGRKWKCTECNEIYDETELFIRGKKIEFCPNDRASLIQLVENDTQKYTEEETKIIGAIRSSSEDEELMARNIADDVGCYVQKVAKFGEKLDREDIIKRKKLDKYIYYSDDSI